jgi:hypothetical protein
MSVVQNPAFSNSHIREMTEIFVAKSAEVRIMLFTSRKCINRGTRQLKDRLLEQIAASPQPGQAKVEITSWLSRATLDIIGLAGFNYSFDALKYGEGSNELGHAFAQIFNSAKHAKLVNALKVRIPILRGIVRFSLSSFDGLVNSPGDSLRPPAMPKQQVDQKSKRITKAQQIMRRVGLQLVREKQQAVLEERASGRGTALEKGKDKDLLSLLIKANMDKDLPAEQQLSVEQILNQIPTFVVAGEHRIFNCSRNQPHKYCTDPYPPAYKKPKGHETSSTSMTWALFALACNPEVQRRLRAELQAFSHNAPSMDELNAFAYLDAVVREALRLYPAIDTTLRVATQPDVIPLAKPFVGRDGVLRNEIQCGVLLSRWGRD